MIRQNFTLVVNPTAPSNPRASYRTSSRRKVPAVELELSHVWEVRHAGLLGIKYEVAVRSDLFDIKKVEEVKTEGADIKMEEEAKPAFDDVGKSILLDVVDAAVLG